MVAEKSLWKLSKERQIMSEIERDKEDREQAEGVDNRAQSCTGLSYPGSAIGWPPPRSLKQAH